MRERLEQDIKKDFGTTYGSRRIKSQLQEIIVNALDRYDEELSNGASEENAYRTAMDSLGDIRELRKELGASKRRNILLLFLFLVCSAALLVAAALIAPLLIFLLVPGLIMIGIGAGRLLTGKFYAKAPHIVLISIGGWIVASFLISMILYFWLTGPMRSKPITHYDYTDQAVYVESVSYVQITNISRGEMTAESVYPIEAFNYTEIKAVNPQQNYTVMKALAELPYKLYSNQRNVIRESDKVILICFYDKSPDLAYVFYGPSGAGFIRRTEDGLEMTEYNVLCETKDWYTFLDKYTYVSDP